MSIYSTYWYRVAEIKPRLRGHVKLYRHNYRGQDWYVLQDRSANRQHRFNRGAYSIIVRLDGSHTLQESWDMAQESLQDEAPTQDEVIRLLGQLHSSDLLQSDTLADSVELFERQESERGKWKKRLSNPFALRFPLVDPDRFLQRLMFLAKPFFGRLALLLWLVAVGLAGVLGLLNWAELTHNIADRLFSFENLMLLWLVYPVVKLVHELGHAFAVKMWGGEVHEMGVMMLAFAPLPYVEASSSAAFPEKRKRIAVAAAGIMLELFLASLALIVWVNIEQGQVSAIAYNVILIGGISTLIFNGNPLLRFDGYYILSDYIEIPNLAQRSKVYLGYLFKKYCLNIESPSPVTAPGEKGWFVCYGIASFIYRIFILIALALFVSGKFFVVGILIAIWGLATQLFLPLVKNGFGLWNSLAGRRRHRRLLAIGTGFAGLFALCIFILPMPLRTQVVGVVSPPKEARVLAGTDCFVTDILLVPDSLVESGQPLLQCEDHLLETELAVKEASLKEAYARYDAEPLKARVQRGIYKEQIAAVEAEVSRLKEKKEQLTIFSPASGRLVLPDSDILLGSYVKQGQLLGYVSGTTQLKAVLVVEQTDVDLVQGRTRQVELRLASRLAETFLSVVEREVPAASEKLPNAVLGTAAGGTIPVDPSDPDGLHVLKKIFQVEVSVPVSRENVYIGERVYARFDHGYEPLGLQWFRTLRKLFLRQFNV